MTITRRGNEILKLAADAQPTATTVQAGTVLRNTDDRKQWYNSGTDWILQDLPTYKRFKVFKDGATTFVTDNNGRAVQSNTDTQLAVQAQLDSMTTSQVYEFEWDANTFTLENPIELPSIAQNTVKKVIMRGTNNVGYRNNTGGTTCLLPSATFPTNRYCFELLNPSGANSGMVEIDKFHMTNSANIAAGKNVGFVKLESADSLGGLDDWVITNIYLNYAWRGVHLVGSVWFGRVENLVSQEFSSSFVGDNIILLEDGGHVFPTLNPTPKIMTFRNIRAAHTAGVYNEFLRMKSGGYNYFENFFINGFKYVNAPLNLNNTDTLSIHNNTFNNIWVVDLNGIPTPDNRLANINLSGTSVFDNYFRGIRGMAYPNTFRLNGTGVVNNDIEVVSYFGLAAVINDTGSSSSNTYTIIGGASTTAANTAITHTGGLGRVIDKRRGAEKGGNVFFTAAKGQTVFTFAHTLFAAPQRVQVRGASDDAKGSFSYTADATNIIVTYAFGVPDSGANNIKFYWEAGVYP